MRHRNESVPPEIPTRRDIMKGIILALGIATTLIATSDEAAARNRNRGGYNAGYYYPTYSSGSYYYPTYSNGSYYYSNGSYYSYPTTSSSYYTPSTTYYTPNTTYYTPNTTYYTPGTSYYYPNSGYGNQYYSYPQSAVQQGINWGVQQLLR
jgi:hypothetical protein